MKNMITIKKIILSISLSLLFTISLSAEETVKVTNFGKGVQATIGSETLTPVMDQELPLNTKIDSGKMGFLEFEYQKKVFRIRQNMSIFIWEVLKAGGDERFQPDVKSGHTGARGWDKIKKPVKKKKQKKKKVLTKSKANIN